MSWALWFALAGACAVIEIATAGFWFLWLAIAGALVAIMVRLGLLVHLPAQIVVFSLISLLLIIFTRPLLLRTLGTREVKSNVASLIGREGMVVKDINPLTGEGQVKLGGELWSAKSGYAIPANTRVLVEAVEGVKLVVREAPPLEH